VQKDADGSFDNPSYTVYDLPDLATLGNATMVGTCDVAPNTCVIGIFAENPGTTGCTTLASGGGGTAETISTPGTLPASSPVTLSSAGTYYWGVTYSGDTNNATSTSTCGTAGEVATVTSTSTPPASTRLKTRLMVNGGHSGRQFGWGGPSLTIFAGTSLTDMAGLTGANAAQATGTVTIRCTPGSSSPRTATGLCNG
jgi:hypothetical protein